MNKLAITAPSFMLIALVVGIAWEHGNSIGYETGIEKGKEIWKATHISEGWTKGYGECRQERLCSELRRQDTLSEVEKIEYKTKCLK